MYTVNVAACSKKFFYDEAGWFMVSDYNSFDILIVVSLTQVFLFKS